MVHWTLDRPGWRPATFGSTRLERGGQLLDAFHTLAEIAVAVAGFSSLVIIFRGGPSAWNPQDYVSLAFALAWSIGSLFLALLPIVLGEFHVGLSASSRAGLFTLVAYMLIVAAVLTYARRRIERAGGGTAQGAASQWMSLIYLIIISGASAAGFGLLPGPVHAWYAAAIVALLAHATAELGLFVIRTIERADPE